MAKYASEFVKQAAAWLGCKESNGSHKGIIDVYNAHKPLARGYKVKYTDEWCATFVSAVAIKLGYTDIIPTECGCQKMIELLKAIGSWAEDENRAPNPGDIIFYDWEDDGDGDNRGNSDHVGIVESVSGNIITVIEGNYNESVARRTIKVNARYIRGYGVPKFDAEQVAKNTITDIAKEVLAGKWGNGADRKKRLESAGYNYLEVQAKVNELLRGTPAVKVGSTVKVKEGAKTYAGGTLASFVYKRNHKVKEIKNDRAVITYEGVTVAAVNVKDLILV